MKAYEGKNFAFIGVTQWLLMYYSNYEGKREKSFYEAVVSTRPCLWSDVLMGFLTMPLIADLIRDLHRINTQEIPARWPGWGRARRGGMRSGPFQTGLCPYLRNFFGVTHPLTESTNLNAFINNIEEMTSQMGVIWERLRESRIRINTGFEGCLFNS